MAKAAQAFLQSSNVIFRWFLLEALQNFSKIPAHIQLPQGKISTIQRMKMKSNYIMPPDKALWAGQWSQ
jgi:hypothetical protein